MAPTDSSRRRADRISAGPGDDRVFAGRGNDVVDAGPGFDRARGWRGDLASDTLNGEEGDDRILVPDGRPDTVTCGPGFDRVRADPTDFVAFDCETVRVHTRAGG